MSATSSRRPASRLHAPLLAFLVAACLAAPATPEPSPGDSPPASPIATSPAPPSATPPATAPAPPTAPPSPTASPIASPTASASPPPSPTVGPSPPSPDPSAGTRLQRILDAQREAYDIPGLGGAVLFADGTRWAGSSGNAQLVPSREVTDSTPFVVGSISKTFVAATILQLAEEGALGLDDPLSRWLPDYPRATDITLRQLLAHSSGVFNYFEHPTYGRSVFGEPGRTWRPDQILSAFSAAPYFEPGAGYHYSNTGFVLLGLVIERITGNTLGEEYQRRFLDPLAMDDTYFQGDGPPPARAAQGYIVGEAGPRLINDGSDYRPNTSAATVAWAAGAIVASATDLATWADALYGGDVLQPASRAALTDFSVNPYAGGSYGLGTRTRSIDGRRAVGHTGSLRGFAAAMWHFPAEGITVVVLSNRGRVDVNPIAERLAIAALRASGYPAP